MCYEYLMDRIDEELNDADGYIEHAHKHKHDHRGVADLLFQLSVQEYNHAGMLVEQMHKSLMSSPDDAWRKIWEWYHKRVESREAAIKMKIDSYKM